MDSCGDELAIVGPIVWNPQFLPQRRWGSNTTLSSEDREVSQSKLGCLALSAPGALRNKLLGDPKGYLKPTLDLLGDTNMPIAVGQMTGLRVAMLVSRRG